MANEESYCDMSPSKRAKLMSRSSKASESVKSTDSDEPKSVDGLSDTECLHLFLKYCPNELGIDLNGKGAPKLEDLDSKDYRHLEITRVKGGITNMLYKGTNTLTGKSVLLRIYGPKTSHIIDRPRERLISRLLSQHGIGKSIYAEFEAGQFEQWIEGTNITLEEMRSFKFIEPIARHLRLLHSMPYSEAIASNHAKAQVGKLDKLDKLDKMDKSGNSMLWPTIWKFYNLCKQSEERLNRIMAADITLEEVKEKIERVQRLCEESKSAVVLCHGDLLHGNIIKTQDAAVRFIDYEYSCYMERAFDIANHFLEHAGFDCDWSKVPDDEVSRRFLRVYLDGEEGVEELLREVKLFYPASHLFWGLWAFMQHLYSSIDFDFGTYANRRLSAANPK